MVLCTVCSGHLAWSWRASSERGDEDYDDDDEDSDRRTAFYFLAKSYCEKGHKWHCKRRTHWKLIATNAQAQAYSSRLQLMLGKGQEGSN